MKDLYESRMSHELFPASWNAYYKVDRSRGHVFSCYLGCFFHLLLWYVNGKMSEKGGIVPKPVGRQHGQGASADCVVLMTSGQALAGWLLSAVSLKTIREDDSIKGNQPARKALVITQAVFLGRKSEKWRQERKGRQLKKIQYEGRRHSSFWGGVVSFERCPGHQSGTWELSCVSQIAACLCVYCVNLAQMRNGREYCLHNKWGHVQFSFHSV